MGVGFDGNNKNESTGVFQLYHNHLIFQSEIRILDYCYLIFAVYFLFLLYGRNLSKTKRKPR